MFHDLAILGHRVGKRDAVFKVGQLIVLDAVARRNMNKTCALIRGDIVGKKHRHVMIIAMAVHRVKRDGALDVATVQGSQRLGRGDADGRRHALDQFGGKADDIPVRSQRAFG